MDNLSQLPKLSVVCPVFNEQEAIPLFYQRLLAVLQKIEDFRYELIFTNNRSTDKSLQQIKLLQNSDPNVHVLTFSRNFGYQASVLAGVTHAQGEVIVVIDVDCEDPPELIPQFIENWKKGYDIVYGLRGKRPEARIITACRRLFYRVLKFTADSDIILDMAEFSLFTRRVRDSIIKNSNTYPFLRVEIAYSGFKKIGIPFNRQARIIGQSNYNIWGMAVFAIAGLLSASTFPLRLPVYLLPFAAVLNLLSLAVPDSFHAIAVLDVLYIILLLTVHGIYLARIYKNGISRPVYIVDWEDSDERLQNKGLL
jgi:dolichol-phosphate mannosyltransferase